METQEGQGAPRNGSAGGNPFLAIRKRLEEAEAARKDRQLDQAQTICEQLLQDFPEYVAALHTLGLVHVDKGEFQRALGYFLRAETAVPDDC